jgi:hypothetical protein
MCGSTLKIGEMYFGDSRRVSKWNSKTGSDSTISTLKVSKLCRVVRHFDLFLEDID